MGPCARKNRPGRREEKRTSVFKNAAYPKFPHGNAAIGYLARIQSA